jgi:hypothetical protein
MKVEVELGARRYVEDRDTAAVVAGSKEQTALFRASWTLVLDGPSSMPSESGAKVLVSGTPSGTHGHRAWLPSTPNEHPPLLSLDR